MAENGGVIVNIIADMFRGFPMMAHTGAARAGVENLTKSLAVEWASDGIRVNSVAPGVIYSPTASANYAADFSVFDMARPGLPSKRLGSTMEASCGRFILIHPSLAYLEIFKTGKTFKINTLGLGFDHTVGSFNHMDKLFNLT